MSVLQELQQSLSGAWTTIVKLEGERDDLRVSLESLRNAVDGLATDLERGGPGIVAAKVAAHLRHAAKVSRAPTKGGA